MRLRSLVLVIAVLLGLTVPGSSAAAGRPPGRVWAIQLPWGAWSANTFRALHSAGVTDVEINLSWTAVEPARGRFDFAVLDADIANAHAAGIGVVPIFWQAVWPGSPAPWISRFEVTSTGAQAVIPSWWDPVERQDYFNYVLSTIAHATAEPGFAGAFLDYGWLDAMWGQPPGYTGITGYAPADIDRFHQWLPTTYGTVNRFNAKYGTDFTAWNDVPAAKPGEALFSVYSTFRIWSVEDTYGSLTRAVRNVTSAPLYYYWGGDLSHAIQYGNIPDIFFRLAHRYDVTVVLDDADSAGLAVAFASLAQAYHVPLLLEWTPLADRPGLESEAAEWLGHAGIAMSQLRGIDFFVYGGGLEYDVGFPAFTRWKGLFDQAGGVYPSAPVALYVRFAPAYGADPQAADNPFSLQYTFSRVSGITAAIKAAWQGSRVPFAVVTDEEVKSGLVSLSHYRAVLPTDGLDAPLRKYAAHGGKVLRDWTELRHYAKPFVSLSPDAGVVDVTPTVDVGRRTARLAVSEHSPLWTYTGAARISYADLGLPHGSYHLVDLATGNAVPTQSDGAGMCVPMSLTGGDLTMWRLSPGPGPAAKCPQPPSHPPTAIAVAGAGPQDLAFLSVGTHQIGSDANMSLLSQGGVPAVATWTLAQSKAIPAGAYAYLQLNPSNPIYRAHRVRIAVTYWATAGQGFTLQYDGSRGTFANGPTVTSPGTGQWVTARLTVPDSWFGEGQNLNADFRLAVSDPTQPLVIRQIAVSR